MIELFQLGGAMDGDSSNETIGKGFVKSAWNVIWRGTPPNMRPESVLGTTLIPNSLLPLSGINCIIHAHYDPIGHRIFIFNANSAGNSAIYVYFTRLGTFSLLIQDGINTQGIVLGFTASSRIHSADIIYQDANNGDLLFFLDSLKRPTKINIPRYLSTPYNPIKRQFINVIKAPSRMPPRVTYENDYTLSVNNCLNALFRFRVRYVYDDNDKSVYNSPSIIPLPNATSLGQSPNSDPTQNSRIAVYISTGDVDVKKLEIWVQQFTDGVIGDWLLVTSLIKSQLSINDNDIYKFLFFNDAQYTAGIEAEILQLQDKVPIFAGAQSMLNGNTPIYGNITEGYNPIMGNITFSVNSNYLPPASTVNGVLFFASQGGVDSYGTGDNITIYLTGTGNNDGSGNPTTIPVVGDANAFVVDCATSSGTSLKIVVNNPGHNISIPSILNAVGTVAISNGFTIVSTSTNSITISYPGVVLYYAQCFNSIGSSGSNQAYFAYPTKSAEEYDVAYFDENGRTIGATLPQVGGINTYEDLTGESMPQIICTIHHRPPPYAYYYSLIRPSALTYNLRLFWVCNQTFTNVDPADNNKYAFIGISNMFDYNQQINTIKPATSNSRAVVSYDFVPGDRIRFLIRYPLGEVPSDQNLINDYEITAVQEDPPINGVIQYGRFIKILYPAADVNFNFDFGGDDFQNYKILIYNYVKHPTNIQNTVYYEFGKMFAIGNPGTNNAYHIGSDQTQSSDLSVPAIISTVEGDLFHRPRLVPAGGIYYINVQEAGFSNQWVTLPTLNDQGVIDNASYQIAQQIGTGASPAFGVYPTIGEPNQLFYNKLSQGVQIRVRTIGEGYRITADKSFTHKMFIKVVTASNATITYLIKTFFAAQSTNQSNSYLLTFDSYVPIPPGAKAWLLVENDSVSGVSNCFIGGFILRLDALNNIQIPIIESSFSDKYNIVANSNSRPIVFDPNAGQFTFGSLVRWGESDLQNTNLNNSNRFYDSNSDEYINNYGSIIRMIPWQKRLRIAQERKWGEIGVYAQFIKNNTGQTELIKSDTIIEKNNIQYFDGDFGIGNQADCIAVNGYQVYYVDPVRGGIFRLSLDGNKQISQEFKAQTFSGNLLPKYLNNYNYAFGGNAVILGVFNYLKDRDSEVIFCFQGGTNGSDTLSNQSIAFIEQTNAFSSFYNFAPDAIVAVENNIYSFYNGEMYIHNNSSNNGYAQFYGNIYKPKITLVGNDQMAIKKKYMAMGYQSFSNKIWGALNIGDILTSFINPQTGLQQISQLIPQDFEINEGNMFAAFLRDYNSGINGNIALLEGDYLLGQYIEITLTAPDNGFNFLYLPFLKWNQSPKTP